MNNFTEPLTSALLLLGGAFMLLAGVGILRMPDLFMRMQAATKAATLGIGCMLLAVAVHFAELSVSARALLVIGLVFLTAPISAHMLARAAYAIGVPLWEGTLVDEYRADRELRPTAFQPPPAEAVSAEETPHEGN